MDEVKNPHDGQPVRILTIGPERTPDEEAAIARRVELINLCLGHRGTIRAGADKTLYVTYEVQNDATGEWEPWDRVNGDPPGYKTGDALRRGRFTFFAPIDHTLKPVRPIDPLTGLDAAGVRWYRKESQNERYLNLLRCRLSSASTRGTDEQITTAGSAYLMAVQAAQLEQRASDASARLARETIGFRELEIESRLAIRKLFGLDEPGAADEPHVVEGK